MENIFSMNYFKVKKTLLSLEFDLLSLKTFFYYIASNLDPIFFPYESQCLFTHN
jgi:hypothetical protein